MSDYEEPPNKVTKYDMNNQYLEGEVLEEGQEEWLSEDLLTDEDDCNRTFEHDQTANISHEDTLPSLETSHEKELNDSQTSQERSVSQCSEDSDATNASLVLDTSKIGDVGESTVDNVQDELKQMEDSRDATPDLPDDLDAYLLRKTDGALIAKKETNEAEKEKEKEAEKEETKMEENDDGNDTDDLLRLLEEGSNNKNKKTVKKAKQEDSSDDDEFLFKGSQANKIKAATNAIIQKRTPTKAVPEDDNITDASSDESEAPKVRTTRSKSKQQLSTNNKQQPSNNNKQQPSNNIKQQKRPVINKQPISKQQQKEQRQQQQKLLNRYQPETSSLKQPLLQLQKVDIKQPLQIRRLSDSTKPKVPEQIKTYSNTKQDPLKGTPTFMKTVEKPDTKPKLTIEKLVALPHLKIEKVEAKQQVNLTKLESIPQVKIEKLEPKPLLKFEKIDSRQQLKVEKLESRQQPKVEKLESRTQLKVEKIEPRQQPKVETFTESVLSRYLKSTNNSQSDRVPKKPILRFVNTPLEPEVQKPISKKILNKITPKSTLSSTVRTQNTETVQKLEKERARKESETNDEIINEEEFMEDGAFDLSEQFVKQETPAKDEEKQLLMKPERMDEEVPTDAESDGDEESLYDELPSSESDYGDDCFIIDLRTERAADYLPLLGDKAYEILTEEKDRVTALVEESRQRLEALTSTGRQQAEQLKKATLALAELDAALGAA